jgi:diacylglycerol kinase family enzyme
VITIIINPVCGNKKGLKLYEPVSRFVEQHQIEADIVKTISPGDGTHLAEVALRKGHDHVVAIGGDGTVNEIACGLLNQGALLGIVPAGDQNSIAKSLNLPTDWQKALAIALRGEKIDVDVGLANDRAFLGSVGLGEIVENISKQSGRQTIMNKLSSPVSSKNNIIDIKASIDGIIDVSAPITSMSIANLSTRSRWQDKTSIKGNDKQLNIMFTTIPEGRKQPDLSLLKCSQIEIQDPAELAIHIDGEVQRITTPLLIQFAPQTQKILVEKAISE